MSSASLDGPWAFWPDLEQRLPTGPGAPFVDARAREAQLGAPRTVHVPGPWQAQFDDLRLWAGTAWYEREFKVSRGRPGGRVRLCFGAVDYFTSVWVDGRLVGEHEGGYLPFAFDITDLVGAEGAHTVTLRVLDVGPGNEDGPFPFSEIPHGKQSWYGPVGGPWQSIRQEERGETFVGGVRIDTKLESGELNASLALEGGADDQTEIAWAVRGPSGAVVAGGISGEPTIQARIPDPRAWDVGTPDLYRLEVELRRAGDTIDRASERFGFRTVAVKDGRVTLNGRPVYLLGALDQDYWMPGITGSTNGDELDRQMRRANELGLNLLRCHIKVPDPRYLDATDTAGLLAWCEPPNWISLTEAANRRVQNTIAGMVERDWNHPSLVIRSLVNEDWGTELPTDGSHREWLRDMYHWLKALDPSRLVVDNSACPPNFHVESDLNDYHLYRAVPEQSQEWREWTSAWVGDPRSTFSPHGDATVRGSEPLILSEFGIWGLPDTDALKDNAGREPWWFVTGGDNSEGIVHPTAVRDRFDAWGLAEAFGSWEGFIRASQEHEFEGLKLEIEQLRLRDAIAGYVITEFTDVHWEANGLLDMRRTPKAFHDRFRRVNAPDVVIVHAERTRYVSGDTVVARVHAIGAAEPAQGRIEWELEGADIHGETEAGAAITFEAPALHEPQRMKLRARWLDTEGRLVNENDAHVWIALQVVSDRPSDVLIAGRWDEVYAHVEAGGRAVIVADAADALPTGANLALEPFAAEEGSSQSIYANGWVMSTGMGWLSPAVTTGLDLGPGVDGVFEGLTPRFVIAGYGPNSSTDMLAGHYLGWLHRMRSTISGVTHGRGAAILCTFPLLEADGKDPLATLLLDRLCALAAEPSFAPRTKI